MAFLDRVGCWGGEFIKLLKQLATARVALEFIQGPFLLAACGVLAVEALAVAGVLKRSAAGRVEQVDGSDAFVEPCHGVEVCR
ncbi:hypothetical protein [Micromonospora sp. NPDC048830]|uniref:hypothetical protein n=1 Tax=Micromonospora sp. NPDC048830 TaxID=3364257 RepID=UPI00371F7627